MASTLKHLRSSTANKRPTASGLADGQIGINTASGTPGVFFKDSNGGVVKVGPAHVGATAPNVAPAGSAGNSLGELWVNDGTTIPGLNYYTGSAFVNLTPSGTTTVAGLVELATDAETQTGTDTVRAVTPSGLQSKISDSTSTTSSTTIASATAVKAAYDLADAALPKAGGRVTGNLEIGPAGSLSFEGSSDDSFETTLAVVDPTADRTITFPNVTGTVVTTGDSGTVTSTMILDGTIINADVNASAAIAGTKVAPDFGSQNVVTTGTATAASLNPTGSSVPTNGVYLPAANSVAISTNGTNRLHIDSDGKVGLGTSSPNELLEVTGNIHMSGAADRTIFNRANNALSLGTNNTARLHITNAGSVGIGTTSPAFGAITGKSLEIEDTSAIPGIRIDGGGSGGALEIYATGENGIIDNRDIGGGLVFRQAGAETARIDSSGRLLVGTSTSVLTGTATAAIVQLNSPVGLAIRRNENNTGPANIVLAKSRNTTDGSFTILQNNDSIGEIRFAGDDGTDLQTVAATITAEVDGTPGANDMPGRLVFSTTADGASSPTERMRIANNGTVTFNNNGGTPSASTSGFRFINSGVQIAYSAASGGGSRVFEFGGNAGYARIMGDGDLENTNNRYTGISDIKLKQNIEDASSQWDDFKAIQVRKYELIAHPERKHIGVVAQELEQVCPGLVIERIQNEETGETVKSVAYSVLYMKAVKALQEAMERIETLEAKVAALEAS
jgi:hypothetical protein